jgi:hypothetical protein
MFSLTSSGIPAAPVRKTPADQLHTIDPDEAGELPVGVHDDVAMHQHRLVDALAQVGEQLGRIGCLALGARAGARQQVIDRGDERGDLRFVTADIHAPRQPAADGDAPQLLRQLDHVQHVAARGNILKQSGDEGEQEA